MKEVLILCTANSCRSQMAEGLINHYLGNQWKAYSAGFEPSFVNPGAIKAMGELGIDISRHTSKGLDAFAGKSFDLVVTVCGDADEKCPVFPGGTKKVHMGFPDPAKAAGTEEEKMQVFRSVRDEMRARLLTFLKNL